MPYVAFSRTLFAGLVYTLLALMSARCLALSADEEFVGPFASWRNLKTDYGALGDGRADDTAALQSALTDLIKHEGFCVLYVPSGTYRLTETVSTIRKAHTDCQGVSIVGEHPDSTVLVWDGVSDGTMFRSDAWYSKISRLTFDGRGRAGVALQYGPAFSTYNETSYLTFRDVKTGLLFGGPETNGQAENEVLGCRFIRCENGLMTVNWNSMDIWVWYCRFEDCGRGIHNVMGNWHAWENVFLRSRVSDVSIENLMAFSVVNNVSVGSRCFLDFSSGHTWGSPTSITGNRVVEPTGDWAMLLDNAGPYLVTDNAFRLTGKARAIRMTWANQTLVGNRYTRANAVEERGQFRRIAERVVSAEEIRDDVPDPIPVPARRKRTVVDVSPGSDGTAIQLVMDTLCRTANRVGERPVVHLPMGRYLVSKTLVIPAGCDLQLVGDGGGEIATRLEWRGEPGGVLLRVQGPSNVTLRDLTIHAPNALGLLLDGVDQEGGRVFADQLNVTGPDGAENAFTAALSVNGLDKTDVLLRALQGSGNSGAWVRVAGGADAAKATNQVSAFTGATGSAKGQYSVTSGGRLVVRGVYHERSSASLTGLHLNDSGVLSIDATRFSYATSATAPTILVDGFRGLFTLATCMLLPVETNETCRFEFRGDGSDASVLALNNQFWVHKTGVSSETVWTNEANPPVRGGLIGCNINTSNKDVSPKGYEFLEDVDDHPDPARARFGSGPLQDRDAVDDATVLRHLDPGRQARVWRPGDRAVSPNATDVRLYRVMVSGGHETTVEFRD